MARYHGRKGVIYLSTSGTGTATSVIALTSWSLDRTADRVDVTAFGDSNKVYVQGLPDVSGEFSGWWDETESKIYQGSDSSDGVKIYLYPSSDAPSKYLYGPAWLSYSIEAAVDGAVKVSAQFAAKGAWGSTL